MRKKSLFLLLATFSIADSISVQKILIQENINIESPQAATLEKQEVKFTRQQDLGEILFETNPEVNLVRASAIGNDLILRGFKKDDVNILIDGAKIYGGCPNRMDPPSMHISASQIEKVEIKEGPFDIENFESLGAFVNVKTKEPKEGKSTNLSVIYGSYNYKKVSLTGDAGDKNVKILLGISSESSDQYEDGDGKTLIEQQWSKLSQTDRNRYQKIYKDKKAYKRNSIWTKILLTPANNQELRLSAYADKATDVLYPAFQMDAQLDKTSMVNLDYSIKNLFKYSKKLSLKTYYSHVKHDMGTEFREYGYPPTDANGMYRTHRVKSTIKGVKLENDFILSEILLKIGVDGSLRNWNGACLNEPSENIKQVRIPDVDTKNRAIFMSAIKKIEKFTFKLGARYDKTDIKAKNLNSSKVPLPVKNYYKGKESKDFNDISGYFLAKYNLNEDSTIFFGLGQSIRVPDAQELYFISYKGAPDNYWTRQGNPELKETKNREADFGYEKLFVDTSIKTTLFYSDLKNYIYAYKNGPTLTWANIDAHMYGLDLSIISMLNDEYSLEFGAAYQRGKKDSKPITTQNDEDLAQIPPLKGRVALNYDGDFFARVEILAAAKQKDIDSDNGEQEIGGWGIVNLKASKDLKKGISLNIGIDNLFDKTYAVNNTYVGRSLIGGAAPILINEPGRFIYANLDFRF